jgi:hypothetical protein
MGSRSTWACSIDDEWEARAVDTPLRRLRGEDEQEITGCG